MRPETANAVWSADFVFDRTAEGRVLKCLAIVDDATTEAVAIVPARALGGLQVTRVLDRLALERGLPGVLRTACYEQVVKALGAVGQSNRGTDTGSGSVEPAHRASSGLIPEERRVPGGRTSSCLRRGRAQDNGGHGLLSGWSRSLRSLGSDRFVPPYVVSVERRAVLDDGVRVVQQFGHAGPDCLHRGQRTRDSLREALIVGFESLVMAEGRQRGHVDHGAQLGSPALGDRRPSGALSAFPSRGLQAGQLHQLSAMLISVEGADLGDQAGDGDPPDPRQRGEIRRLVKRLEEGLEFGGDVIELGPDEVNALHQPGHFTHGGCMPMGRRHRSPGFLPHLLNLEAPHPPSAPVRLHDSDEGWLRQLRDVLRGQARPQHGEASRSRDRFPLADDLREDAVELMHQQGLESCALAAKTVVLAPGPPPLHVLSG